MFLVAFILVLLLTGKLYWMSLDYLDSETHKTGLVLRICIGIWVAFWICWSVFCARMTFVPEKWTNWENLAMLIITVLPGFGAYLFARSVRLDQLRERDAFKRLAGDKWNDSGSDILYSDRKYYCGYYGLISLPVYLVCVLVHYLL
ncbi:hypothetical protein FPE01S_02_02260 [Flavihumibacter petaseus NBRC 106054]|uniref:Uncharacterized protein n=2 Tax=Flavihumibacter TaxID=1004301 RepID=A0A0E9MZF0_9BACT|nr:hypothetical protein FPE01S_02_02260 [Flavihumibacter petaseus NBRC 106054]